MDAEHSPAHRADPVQGGTVEPENRAHVRSATIKAPNDAPDVRYELRDPFAEVTYRASTFEEMVSKAERLGSTRFFAVTGDGKRTPIHQVDGTWHRDEQRTTPPERLLNARPAPENAAEGKTFESTPGPTKPSAQPELGNAKAIARIDAQAERTALVARLEAALMERYVIKRAPVTVGDLTFGRTEYRFRGDTSRVAFTESSSRLATDTNSPSVARSMVDVAEARNWKAVRVSGNEDFKRMVWLEASVRGVKTQGYDPNPGDLEVLKRTREARLVNRIEPDAPASPSTTSQTAARGSGGRKTVLAAIEAILVAQRVPETRREAILASAADNLAKRLAAGVAQKVKVYDKAAPRQQPVMQPAPERQRTQDRAAPVR